MTPEKPTPSATPTVAIVGRSGSGKTTLLVRLIGELQGRGYRVAAVKHLHRTGVPFDVPGKDSHRFAEAGADQVVLAAPDRVVHVRRYEEEPPLAEVVAAISGVDLVLVEGHKQAPVRKIEVSRRARSDQLACAGDELLIAVVSDAVAGDASVGDAEQPFDVDVPRFGLDDVEEVADFIVKEVLGKG